MITCHVKYVIDPYQLAEFEAYSKAWIAVVRRLGGTHHGYFMPCEGASNIAYCLFSFPSLADYEAYRQSALSDPESVALVAAVVQKRFILSYERSFMRPLLS
ncbi:MULTISPECIES: NIPSNAP family protein [unclassified Pseudomonas]|uniref:NIPSNAP family protein n=1 Tax=unclassified Pseudomonas TaxID=196821 RepID=UPI00087752D9|nr:MULTISPECIES: NIPSNAP family protein [unclassified Pseudomonas]SCZ53669.1 NIPSNAP protein [Pseudomonas sp. NFPP17]SDA42655.1 NIPSNAP protein [Pseudomonas sp. NFPP15]SEK35410.1 NIPSNAP protein [Pseudomonas sp. NFPP18]SFA42855.1 NIPSNAP protein [Pseudomonas sp. NFPP13]SFT44795.1 NIPSNAP protein [Pseudomonas sp. NFPP25]